MMREFIIDMAALVAVTVFVFFIAFGPYAAMLGKLLGR